MGNVLLLGFLFSSVVTTGLYVASLNSVDIDDIRFHGSRLPQRIDLSSPLVVSFTIEVGLEVFDGFLKGVATGEDIGQIGGKGGPALVEPHLAFNVAGDIETGGNLADEHVPVTWRKVILANGIRFGGLMSPVRDFFHPAHLEADLF
jgi:hypothetical protein